MKKLSGKNGNEEKTVKNPPVIMKTVSETNRSEIKKQEAPAVMKIMKAENKVAKEDIKVQKKEAPVIDRSLKMKEQSVPRPTAPIPQVEGGILKPSQVKSSGFFPNNNQQKPQEKPVNPAKNKQPIDFPVMQTPPVPAPVARPVPGRLQQIRQQEQVPQQTFIGTADLENMDFVRRPTRPPPQDNTTPPPAITVIPSTPKPSDVPVPSSPTHDIIVKKASVNTPAATHQKENTKPQVPKDKTNEGKGKPAESKEKPKAKVPAPKAPVEKTQDQKPSTPPAATFQNNSSSQQDEPLIGGEGKKAGWL